MPSPHRSSDRAPIGPVTAGSIQGRSEVVSPSEGLIGIPGLARRLGTTVRHVRRLVAERRIPYLKVGGLIRFDPIDIAVWLEGQKVLPTDSEGRRKRKTYADGSGPNSA